MKRLHFTLQLNHSLGEHKTTAVHSSHRNDDDLHVHSRMRQLFATEPKYLVAFCHMYLVDYMCFPEYDLPEPCHGLNATRAVATDMFRRCGIGSK